MPRESTIQILRSTGTDTPTGLTFGELAYSDVNEKLFVGDQTGNSIWIGAQVTSGNLATNSQYIIPTQSAVKSYVDTFVGGGAVSTVNGGTGVVTITGSGAITQTVSGTTTTFGARVASTSVTGVASFRNTHFTVDTTGHVQLASGYQVTGDTVSAGTGIGVARSGNQVTVSNTGIISLNGITGVAATLTGGNGAISVNIGSGVAGVSQNYVIDSRLASTSVTGVASFNTTDFTVGNTGHVSINTGRTLFTIRDENGSGDVYGLEDTINLTGGQGIDVLRTSKGNITFRGATASSTVVGVASYNNLHFTVATTGHVQLASAYQVTGQTVVSGGASQLVSTSGNTVTIDNRLSSTSLTGVASFRNTHFTVDTTGHVQLAAAYQVTGDTVVAGSAIAISTAGNTKTISSMGVTSFNGATGAITFTVPLATNSLTGTASFNPTVFAVSATGNVNINNSGISNTMLANSTITIKAGGVDSGQAISLGNAFSITGTINQVSVSRSSSEFTIGLPNDVTIPGNLTVNGTVITANVDTFVVEDPLFMLGTGNAADSVDLGFYAQYTSSGKRFAGIFRDASDSGKFKFFTGLSGAVEPTTFVNDAGSGYTVATVVAKIDGGTF